MTIINLPKKPLITRKPTVITPDGAPAFKFYRLLITTQSQGNGRVTYELIDEGDKIPQSDPVAFLVYSYFVNSTLKAMQDIEGKDYTELQRIHTELITELQERQKAWEAAQEKPEIIQGENDAGHDNQG